MPRSWWLLGAAVLVPCNGCMEARVEHTVRKVTTEDVRRDAEKAVDTSARAAAQAAWDDVRQAFQDAAKEFRRGDDGDHEVDHVVATSLLSQSSRPSPKSAIHTNRARSSLPWAVSGQRSTRKKLTGTESGSRRAAAQAAKASAPGSTALGRSS